VHPLLRTVADRQLGVFTARDVRRAGFEPEEVRALLSRREWTSLRRGVYVETRQLAELRADPRLSHLLDCVAVLVCLDPGPVLSHASAARFHGLPVPRGDEVVRLTDEEQWRTGRAYRVTRAALPPDDVQPFLRFAATTPARTLVDCAREWSITASVIAMDAAVQTQLVTRAELVAAVLAGRHRVGIGSAGRALSLADGRSESPLETRGRLALLAGGLPLPELQVEVHDERGMVGRVDAWYDDAALALEFDGKVKYTQPRGGRTPAEVAWEEKRREDRMRLLGARFVRIADEDLGRPWPGVLDRIRALRADPVPGPRRFHLVRTAEPGTAAAA
jgi:predicted transcriptional regulator of viral defense system